MERLCFGIDIGGTSVKLGLFSDQGSLLDKWNFIVYYDEDTGTYSANLLLYGLAATLRLAVWATILASIIGIVMGYWRTC